MQAISVMTNMKDLMAKVADQFPQENTPYGLQESIKASMVAVEKECGLDREGAMLYKKELSDFKAEGRRLVDLALGHQESKLASDNQGKDALKRDFLAWSNSTFRLMQLASWAESATHDRKVITWIKDNMHILAYAGTIGANPEVVMKAFGVLDRALPKSLELILGSPDGAKPMLFWLVEEDDLCARIMDFARDLHLVVSPCKDTALQDALAQVEKAVAKMANISLDESTGEASEARFLGHYNQKLMKELHAARMELKDASGRMIDVFEGFDARRKLPDDILDKCTMYMHTSRLHTVKYGLYSLARHPKAAALDESGAVIRSNLREAWAAHSDNETTTNYLGPELIKLIESTLEIKEPDCSKGKSSASGSGGGGVGKPAAAKSAAAKPAAAKKRAADSAPSSAAKPKAQKKK